MPAQINKKDLKLSRPLVFIDTDSTGLDVRNARIIRLATLKLYEDGTMESRVRLINPGMPIPPGATLINGITDSDVRDASPFSAYASGIAQFLHNCDMAGYGVEKFHLPLIQAEFERSRIDFPNEERSVVDLLSIFYRLAPRDFYAAYANFADGDPPPRSDAEGRLRAMMDILLGQMASSSEIGTSPVDIMMWSKGWNASWIDKDGRFIRDSSGEILVNFGRYAGERLLDVKEKNPGYLLWIASNDNFNEEARNIARETAQNE